MTNLIWSDVDMSYENKDAIEDALAMQMRSHELKAIEHERLARVAKDKGDASSYRWNMECSAIERQDMRKMHEAYVKVCGGLGLRVVDCSTEVEEDVSDCEPGSFNGPPSAA